MVHHTPCYDDPVKAKQEQMRAASKAAARARTLAKHRRWADEMRAAGWKVEEPE